MIALARAGLLVAGAMLAIAPAAMAAAPAAGTAPASAPAKASGVTVSNAWLRLSPVAGRPGGGFFTLKGGTSADQLLSVSSPAVARIEMHETTSTNGVMAMEARDSVDVPAGATVEFAPRGRHLMLFGVAASVKPGDRLPLTFAFKSGAKVTVEAEARSVAGTMPASASPGASGHRH